MSRKFNWLSILTVTLYVLTANNSFAQDGHIVYIQTWEFQIPENGSWGEFDSLTTLMTQNVTQKNPKMLNMEFNYRLKLTIYGYLSVTGPHFAGRTSNQIFVRE